MLKFSYLCFYILIVKTKPRQNTRSSFQKKAVDSNCNETCFDIAITASFITSKRVFNTSILEELKELYQFNGSYVYPKNLGTYRTYWWEETRVGTDAGTFENVFFKICVIYSL